VIFESLPQRWHGGKIVQSVAKAGAEIDLFSIIRGDEIPPGLSIARDKLVPWLDNVRQCTEGAFAGAAMAMIPDGTDVAAMRAALKKKNAEQIVAIRVPATPTVTERVIELVEEGAEVIHLVFDAHGREDAPAKPRHVRDVLRDVHGELVKEGTRDLVTLVASGGVVQAEHVVKAVVCGADLVAVDLPLVVAMECRLCGECERGETCSIAIDQTDQEYATRRVINLIGAWHQQMIEMLGAMGIREVRRLRGETGRCMFFEDLERETFGRLFGKRKDEESLVHCAS
jgi:hypothetical protein